MAEKGQSAYSACLHCSNDDYSSEVHLDDRIVHSREFIDPAKFSGELWGSPVAGKRDMINI